MIGRARIAFGASSSCLVIAGVAFATPALAQDANTDQSGVADIIVTAERTAQNFQKVPLTISVVDGDQLRKAGVTDTTALQTVTNGVQIGQGGANAQVFIRGVGSNAFSALTSPGVAFNVDGVYVGRPDGVEGNFYDLERVEVLKGPQGTLYGRNATGGAINLITNRPKLGQTSLDLDLEAGNYDLLHAAGAVNLPLGDTAALRTAFNITHRDGYLSDGTNDDVQQSVRTRLLWEPSDAVSLLLNVDYSHIGGKGGDYVFLPRRPGSSAYEAVTTPESNAYVASFGGLAPLLAPSLPENYRRSNLLNVSAQLDVDLSFATLTVLPAYRYVDSNFLTHFTSTLESHGKTHQTSLEARLGNSNGALTWVVGGYFFNEKIPDNVTRTDNGLFNFRFDISTLTRSYAGFGQATLSLTDRLRIIAGGRYTHERKTLTGSQFDTLVDPVALITDFDGRRSFNSFTYRLGAQYDLTPANMLYATFSTGDRSGGFSQTIAPNSYDAERLNALEVGSRNRFFDNKLQVNLSGYYWKYKKIQDSRPAFDALGNLNLITFNSGDATIYGGTIDVTARPTRADTLTFSAEYAHSRYDNFAYLTPAPVAAPGSTGCTTLGPFMPGEALPIEASGTNVNNSPVPQVIRNCAGFQVARVPRWSGTVAYTHRFDLANGGAVDLGGSVNYASARWITIDFIPTERDDAYAIVNANLDYTSADGRMTIGLFGRNLTKTVYYTGGIQSGVVAGLVAANISAPRTYGVRASFRFR